MSAKKKNPLKDLNAFLAHQQEASKVTAPKQLSETEEFMGKKPTQIAAVNRPSQITVPADMDINAVEAFLIEQASNNGEAFRNDFYRMIQAVAENMQEQQPADKMLINTTLYLANQANWKEAVETYWKNK